MKKFLLLFFTTALISLFLMSSRHVAHAQQYCQTHSNGWGCINKNGCTTACSMIGGTCYCGTGCGGLGSALPSPGSCGETGSPPGPGGGGGGGGGGNTNPPPPTCRSFNSSCTNNSQCCSNICSGGTPPNAKGKGGTSSTCKKFSGCAPAGKVANEYANGCCAGTSPNGKGGTCSCDTPSAPTNLAPNGVAACPGNGNLTWEPAGKEYNLGVQDNNSGIPYHTTCFSPQGKDHVGNECAGDVTNNSWAYGKQAGNSYSWNIQSINTAGVCHQPSGKSNASFTVSSQPAAPSNLQPSGGTTPGSHNITWTASSNADANTRYNLYIDNQANGWNGNCSSPLSGDSCALNRTTTSYNYTFPSSSQYHLWVTATSCSFPESAQADSFLTVPNPIPTVAIQGNLREYDGPSCPANISTNGLALSISAQYPSGVTPVCNVTPATGTTKTSYQCNVSFDEFANPTPVKAQNLTLSATTTEYQAGYLVDSAVCEASGSSSIAIDVSGSTPTTTFNKDLLFKIAKSWIKIKNGSFASALNVSNPIPLTVGAYDAEDDASQRVFIMNSGGNDPGAATARALNIGTADASSKKWKADYQKLGILTPATFLEYIKARKEFKNINQSNLSQLENGTIHVWTGDLTIDASNIAQFNSKKVVLIATGTVNITQDFNPSGALVAIIANTITFAGDPTPVQSVSGLFVAETINTGTTAAQGLKITGNLVATSALVNNRTWGSNSRPGIFISFNPTLYMELLPYVSVAKYEYQQTQ